MPGEHSVRAPDHSESRRELGPIFIRLFLAVFLVYMSQDNVFSAARMAEFETFLRENGLGFRPDIAARVSVYAQFAAGLLLGAGLLTRTMAAIMVVNFLVALALVHASLPFRTWLEPCAMLSGALFLLVHGPGRFALDNLIARRSRG